MNAVHRVFSIKKHPDETEKQKHRAVGVPAENRPSHSRLEGERF
jgi:hypothetical protein